MNTSGYYLTDENGSPFFWLADTAWNLWCRGTPEEWDEYLAHRAAQGFNTIQFVGGWWRGSMNPIHGRPFDLDGGKLVYNESAWESLDLLFEKIHGTGMVAAPIMLWTLTDIDPGQVLSEEQCIEVARRQVERWNAPNVVWLLGGDGNYTSPEAEARWKRIGRAVFGDREDVLATLHTSGVTWVGDAFAEEPWYKLATIQSGHGSVDDNLRFLVDGEYARAHERLKMPFLNLEPNYEDARSYIERKHLTAYHVRRASYWSLLVAPPAGVTYGIGSIWMWACQDGEIAENHDESWVGKPWREDLDTPGAHSMTVLRAFFEKLPWTRLRPAQELLVRQPGRVDLEAWQAIAATPEGDCFVAYTPKRNALRVDASKMKSGLTLYVVDPVNGEWSEHSELDVGGEVEVSAEGEADDALVIAIAKNVDVQQKE